MANEERATVSSPVDPRMNHSQPVTTVETRTETEVSTRRMPLGGYNPIDDPLANRAADLLNGVIPPICALLVVVSSIVFVHLGKVNPDVWLLILGAVVGYLFGIQTRDKTT